ncbi:MAG: DegT/DnrJ/EryC1/StrS family aminotransferase [bacterium]
MRIPIPRYRPGIPPVELAASLARVLFKPDAGGGAVSLFERKFAEKTGARFAIAVSSVRFALFHAVKILGLDGAEILCTPITIYPVIEALRLAGLKPVFVDLDPAALSMDLADAARKASGATKALLVTHLWGVPSEMGAIARFAERRGLVLLEDASQCLNGAVEGKKTGTFGTAGFFSLGMSKTLNAYRGAVMVTDDPVLRRRMREVVEGLPPLSRAMLFKYVLAEALLFIMTRRAVFTAATAPLLRLARLLRVEERIAERGVTRALRRPAPRPAALSSSLQAAFTDAQALTALKMLDSLDSDDERRREIAGRYIRGLAGLPSLEIPAPAGAAVCNYWVFVVFAQSRGRLKENLWRKGRVDSAAPMLDACHEIESSGSEPDALPAASMLMRRALYLPLYPSLTDRETCRVIETVRLCAEDAGCGADDGHRAAGNRMYSARESLRGVAVTTAAARSLFAYCRGAANPAPPLAVAWEITYRCDLACPFCATRELGARSPEPSRSDVLAIAGALGEARVGWVAISGGEPLLSEHLVPAIETLRDHGCRVSVCTNGARLARFAPAAAELGVSSITVSLDSLKPEVHDALRGAKGLYEEIENTLDALSNGERNGRPAIRIRFLVTAANYGEMVAFAGRWRGRVDEVCFQPVQDLGADHVHHARDGSFAFTPAMEGDFRRQVRRLASLFPEYRTPYYAMMPDFVFSPAAVKNAFHCLVPAVGFKVSPCGGATPCSAPGTVIGNVAGRGVMELWNDPALRSLRSKSRRLRRDCLCWVQPVQLSFIPPTWIFRLIPPAARSRP